MRRPFSIALLLAWAPLGAGCLITIDERLLEQQDGGVADAGPTPDGGCPSDMVTVPADPPFCMDRLEVRNGAYEQFLAIKGGDVSGQPTACASWNQSYQPSMAWPPSGRADYPVVWIDWCDAAAYCAAVGKRLCGRIGGGGLAVSEAAGAASEWSLACSQAGARAYPYGASYQLGSCNGDPQSPGQDRLVKAGSKLACEGGYAGLFDLSGNASEWIDACDPAGGDGHDDSCATMGGGVLDVETTLTCTSLSRASRNTATAMLGVRCCR